MPKKTEKRPEEPLTEYIDSDGRDLSPEPEPQPEPEPRLRIAEDTEWSDNQRYLLETNLKSISGILRDFRFLAGYLDEIRPHHHEFRNVAGVGAFADGRTIYIADVDRKEAEESRRYVEMWKQRLQRAKSDPSYKLPLVKFGNRAPVIPDRLPNAENFENMLTHELGHTLQNYLHDYQRIMDIPSFWEEFAVEYGEKYGKLRLDKYKQPTKSFIQTNAPTMYGKYNAIELISEAVADYYLSDNPAEISKSIVELYHKLFAKYHLETSRAVAIGRAPRDVQDKIREFGADEIKRYIEGGTASELEAYLAQQNIVAESPAVLPPVETLAKLPAAETAEHIATMAKEEIISAVNTAIEAALNGQWGVPSEVQRALRTWVIDDYRLQLVRGGSMVADSEGKAVFLPWLRDAQKELGSQLANIIDKARSIDEVEEGIRALVNRTDQWAETVARTETLSVANEANRRMYAAEGVEKVQIIAGKDERTCPICKQHHMRVYPIDKAPHLPLHPNCRCVYVPYISEGS